MELRIFLIAVTAHSFCIYSHEVIVVAVGSYFIGTRKGRERERLSIGESATVVF